MRFSACLLSAWLVACGGKSPGTLPDGGDGDAGGGDGDGGSDSDAAPACGLTWELIPVASTSAQPIETVPVNSERSFRVRVDVTIPGCAEPAMNEVQVDRTAMTAVYRMRAWNPAGPPCEAAPKPIVRYLTLKLGAPGVWTIRDAEGPVSLTIDVAAPPPTPCGQFPCQMDCDCAGGVCLSGNGIGGAFTACAQPCEMDMDCRGGRCESPDDGLESVCGLGSQCGGTIGPCPTGYLCNVDVCEPDFTLGSATRVPCSCDADCVAPLACVEPLPGRPGDPPGERRCELRCPTGSSRWCQGPHMCGDRSQDVANLAETDAVCVFIGE